ncbi:MAG: hypothetical protein DRQ40_09190 [Gammaproteobacteria bacterium]|nr:MAG: hypothetical protein DRQ40_09190 [Gammaproteobacteria bacterium]
MSGITICECGTKKVHSRYRPNDRHKNWKCRSCAHRGLPTWNTGLTKLDHPSLQKASILGKKLWTPERIKSHREHMERQGYWTPLSAKTAWQQYKMKCKTFTRANDLTKLKNHENVTHTTGGSGFTLDHMFSVHEGFKNDIPPEIIGSVVNLCYILCSENSSKHTGCSITKEELYERFNKEGESKNVQQED